jgi:hypothetical protein
MPVRTRFVAATTRRADMPMIYVKTKPGRKLFFEGKIIPEDKFVPVTDNPFIRRLIDHWEDLEVEGGGDRKRPAAKTKAATPGYTKDN